MKNKTKNKVGESLSDSVKKDKKKKCNWNDLYTDCFTMYSFPCRKCPHYF